MSMHDYASFTSYRTYRDCPHQFHSHYILKERPEVEVQNNFVKGNALHHLLEGFCDGKEEPQWIVDNAAKYWDAELEAIAKNPRHTLEWKGPDDEAKQRKQHLDWALELARLLHKYGLKSTEMASEFKADTRTEVEGIRFKMAGRIDIMMETNNGGIAILDLKASASSSIADYDQLAWYSHLAGLKLQRPVEYVGHILPAFKKITLFHVPQEARDKLMVNVAEALRRIRAGQFDPAPAATDPPCWFCPIRWKCPAQGGAVEHKNGIVDLGGGSAGIDTLL